MKDYTTKQRLLTILLSLVSLAASAYDIEVDGIYYNVTSAINFTASVTYGDSMYEGTIIIPPTIEYKGRTLTVTEIERSAFSLYGNSGTKRNNAIRTLIIPNTLLSIPNDALYYCTSLDSLIIQDGDTEIDLGRSTYYYDDGYHNFYYYGPLYHTPTSYVYIGRNIKTIRGRETVDRGGNSNYVHCEYQDQFYSSRIKVAEVGDKVTSTPYFYKSGLKKVTLGKGITEIGEDVFRDCTSLSDISMYDNVECIGTRAFYNCKSLKNIRLSENLRTIEWAAFEGCSLTQIDIPESVTSIGSKAFYNTCITDITIPNKVTYVDLIIGNCNITLGNAVETIDYAIFTHNKNNTINIHTLTPPQIESPENISTETYINVNINVPAGAKEAYMQADVWKNFWNINDVLSTDIESITDESAELAFSKTSDGIALSGADGENVGVYSINGVEVQNIKEYHGQNLSLPKGIYIVKAGQKSMKVRL